MKRLIYILIVISLCFGIASCSKEGEERQKWEYKTLVSEGLGLGDFGSKTIMIPHTRLDSLGKEGWELVDVYSMIETVHPNFGNAKYVTGIQPNTRTESVHYIFKRPFDDKDTTKRVPVEIESTDIVYIDTASAI